MTVAIVDTGPLVAFFDRAEQQHRWVAERFEELEAPLLGLRAGDALHLATASEYGATVHTLDQRLAAAGPVLGVPTQLLA